ncbi:MAG: alpha-hydroxy-acid oxidizing protein [Bryobacterales bacterium]|nr:alpha-hydroxy-acid oxidizing protein [Bryobacterales bacterium]
MNSKTRRAFLKFMAGSPYVAALGGVRAFAADVITSPADALDVMDFEEAARRRVMPGHWAYMVSGVDDDVTLHANREGLKHVQLRPRRLIDATKVDTRATLWGETFESPVFLCPTGGEKFFHPEGELAVARAAKARSTLQVLSNATSIGVEDVSKAYGRPVWYQLYAASSWAVTERIVRRVQAAGCPSITLTVDNITGRNSQTYKRLRPKDMKQCAACHDGDPGTSPKERRMFDGIDMSGVSMHNPALDWAFVDRLRKLITGKFLIKGIDTSEDARLAVEHGFDGIWVSNHGGRGTETGRSTIEALPEVVEEVRGRVPVFVDGGFRRGTDVFKALALGAAAVGVGRPFLWGLGAFGEAGVNRVIEILQGELKLVMRNCGTQTIAQITRERVSARW